ncbi:hypothetical protein Tco_1518211, partial [Tanacetum coccineum]
MRVSNLSLFEFRDVKNVVLKCFESKEQGQLMTAKRDIVILNEENKLSLLTFWNNLDEQEGHILANMIGTPPMRF